MYRHTDHYQVAIFYHSDHIYHAVAAGEGSREVALRSPAGNSLDELRSGGEGVVPLPYSHDRNHEAVEPQENLLNNHDTLGVEV